jgi:hypothetical protein
MNSSPTKYGAILFRKIPYFQSAKLSTSARLGAIINNYRIIDYCFELNLKKTFTNSSRHFLVTPYLQGGGQQLADRHLMLSIQHDENKLHRLI